MIINSHIQVQKVSFPGIGSSVVSIAVFVNLINTQFSFWKTFSTLGLPIAQC